MDNNARAMHERWPPANENTKSAAFDGYRLEKILCQRKSDFIEDFSYADIHRDMESNRILPSEKLSVIKAMKFERERIEYLFFLLVYNASVSAFDDFLHILRDKYEWLAERIRLDYVHNLNRTEDTATDSGDYHESIVRLRKEIPKHVDFNVHRCKFVSFSPFLFLHIWPMNTQKKIKKKMFTAVGCASAIVIVGTTSIFGSAWQFILRQTVDRNGRML